MRSAKIGFLIYLFLAIYVSGCGIQENASLEIVQVKQPIPESSPSEEPMRWSSWPIKF